MQTLPTLCITGKLDLQSICQSKWIVRIHGGKSIYLLIIFIFAETKEVLHMSTYADVSLFDCTEIPQFNLQVRVNRNICNKNNIMCSLVTATLSETDSGLSL